MDIMLETSIQRVKEGRNLGFLFEDDEMFSAIGYKVSQAPDKNCFLKSARIRYNGQIKLIYFVEDYQTLSTILTSITPNAISVLLYKLIYAILQIPEYGYISCENLLISSDDIYFEQKTLEPKFVYIPSNAENAPEAQKEFENRLRHNLYNALNSVGHADVQELRNMLSDTSDGLDGLLRKLQKMANFREVNSSATEAKGMILKCSNPNYNLNFQITKDYFTLGRGRDSDGVLNVSNMISRKHCSVLRKNKRYYLMDEGSTKGTFLNGKSCQRMVEIPLHEGDIIKIWELSFVVKYI